MYLYRKLWIDKRPRSGTGVAAGFGKVGYLGWEAGAFV
jgi:hypothetical protein